MPPSRRRSLPDNLDPLVDTLSNVVGILVVVVILTQLQVGDALERLVELDSSRLPGAIRHTSALEVRYAELRDELAKAELRQTAILDRSDGSIEDAIAAAQRSLDFLASAPEPNGQSNATSMAAIERELDVKTKALEERREKIQLRGQYANEIETVPKELVARLPNPTTLTGEENWILCRYARCYLADRFELIQSGSGPIGQILQTGGRPRNIRPDEFESLALHFRKRDIGHGNFRWRLLTRPQPHARLEWRSKDAGIERTRLASSPALAKWLRKRSPDHDFIRFQVWSDSFEVYLEAREIVESAGFRAGWDGFAKDAELDLNLSFGRPPPREGPVRVD